jgi:1-pyrroline-5-carboxylate dehydrogenase
MLDITKSLVVGQPDDPSSFTSAVIDQRFDARPALAVKRHAHPAPSNRSFDKISGFIQRAKTDPDVTLLIGGKCDDSSGFFISPTILESRNPKSETMVQEIFGPVLTVTNSARKNHRPQPITAQLPFVKAMT